ncbi:endonuclease/exonuclease/phosphatase family protein [Streptomyces salinarius]|uniref:endonuclease/exonuclease/phosphatase family protein n=1 Tax=Streptomyces salinarius TaxID=2762598 RepID=UPI0028F6FE80|nr:FG-GAP-like repeat-containing protein [Streptomyces salinarius]
MSPATGFTGPFRRALAVTTATLAALAGFTTVAPGAHADGVDGADAPPLRFVSYNLCGNECSDVEGFDNDKRIDSVVKEATGATWNADQLYLQEVCRPQYDAIRSKLQPHGFNGLFTTTMGNRADICGGSDYGVAVLVKGVVVDSKVLDLTVGGESEPIKVPCVKTYTQSRANWGCSVHLYWRDPDLAYLEATQLAEQARLWQDAGLPVVLGGDFNAGPRSKVASQFYEPAIDDGGVGIFLDADETDRDHFIADPCADGRTRCRSGEYTFENQYGATKIDYLFLSARQFTGAKADALPLDHSVSDHRLLRGAAYWADCPRADPAAGAVLRRDATGGLFRYTGRAGGGVMGACKVGVGWQAMRLMAREGSDVLAADANGILWRYPADGITGTYTGATRVEVGSGWQVYDSLLAPGDFSGDGKADLIARDTAGTLWLYKGNGATSYGPREKIGTQWQIYTSLLAPGDFSGDGKADLIARDTAGTLWLYKGNGASSYSPREKIGTQWQIYTALAAPGDLDEDGRADLVGRDADGGLWFYKGNGASSYSPRNQIGVGYPDGELLI